MLKSALAPADRRTVIVFGHCRKHTYRGVRNHSKEGRRRYLRHALALFPVADCFDERADFRRKLLSGEPRPPAQVTHCKWSALCSPRVGLKSFPQTLPLRDKEC
ncbi:MAG: hypothetical protein JO283_14220 [Bradyrhizobium sp.]|nr:hypothetical protein [Bradyrhizobium sp.]